MKLNFSLVTTLLAHDSINLFPEHGHRFAINKQKYLDLMWLSTAVEGCLGMEPVNEEHQSFCKGPVMRKVLNRFGRS